MTKVKICGITNLEDAQVARQSGADLLGFIFYEPSPRYVAPEVAREIMSGVRCQVSTISPGVIGNKQPLAPQFVGVFVNAPLETVEQILDFCQLDAVQLHGEEPPEFVNHFKGRAFKAMRPQAQVEADKLLEKYSTAPFQPDAPTPHLPYFLIDAYHPTLYGGTGRVTDWTMATNIARRFPILLAGSLTPTNVAQAIRTVQPWGVDVSSGVEVSKGKKDHKKVQAFVQAVRSVTGSAGKQLD